MFLGSLLLKKLLTLYFLLTMLLTKSRTLETEKYISFLMKKGSNMKKWFMLFYDKSSGKIGRINCFSNKEIVFPIAKNADKTSLYAVVEKNREKNDTGYGLERIQT